MSLQRPRRYLRTFLLPFVFLLLIVGVASPVGSTSPRTSPDALVPSANISPNPNFFSSGSCYNSGAGYTCPNPCVSGTLSFPVFTNAPDCTAYLLGAMNAARATVGERAMELPSNWFTLTQTEQLFVLANLDRVGLGYPPYLGLNANLSAEAQTAAQAYEDPSIALGFKIGLDSEGAQGVGGTWGQGFNALETDYAWMFLDGWGGSIATTPNFECTAPTNPGCWGHRLEILGSDPGFNPGVGLGCTTCEMGAGYAVVNGSSSWVDLIELPAGSPPAMTFTWASEVPYFDPGYLSSSTTSRTVAATTTTTTVPLSVPQSATFKKLSFKPNSISVSWSSPGARGIKRVMLRTYLGTSCSTNDLTAVSSYEPSSNTTSGTITYKGSTFTNTKVVYAASVQVVNAAGSTTSTCISLGKS